MEFKDMIKKQKQLVGMVHVRALPGTPKNIRSPQEIINKAIEEAQKLKELGINTVLIENMHDNPYKKQVGPEITSMMSIIGKEIKKQGLYCGIQILAGANKEALAAAKSAGLDFVRVEGFVYGHIADEGYMDSCAGELLRYRKAVGAEDILIFTDIKKKHSSHTITEDTSIQETAHTAEFFLSDGIILTGTSTGTETSLEELKKVKDSVSIPIAIGSGLKDNNIKDFYDYADIFIVGSFIKQNQQWENELSETNIKSIVKEFNDLK